MSRRRTLIVAVLGSTSVGKSALTDQFVNEKFIDYYDPTVASTFMKKFDANNLDLIIHDTAGLEQQSQIQGRYVNSNGFILVYSITDRQSFKIIRDVYEKLTDVLNGEDKPVILIGNKIDLSEKRRVSYEEGKQLAKEMNAEFLETSARLGNNVKDVFLTLLNKIDAPNIYINNNSIISNNNKNINTNTIYLNSNNNGILNGGVGQTSTTTTTTTTTNSIITTQQQRQQSISSNSNRTPCIIT